MHSTPTFRSGRGTSRARAVLTAVALACALAGPAASDDPPAAPLDPDGAAARALVQLVGRQKPDGSFAEPEPAGFKLYERHPDGAHGLAGLAILAQAGDHPALHRAIGWLLGRQRADGCFTANASKCNLEHAYCLQLLIEVLLAHRSGEIALAPERWAAVDRAVRGGVAYLAAEQLADGSWAYGEERTYREAATWVPVMEALLLARRLGLELPPRVLRSALGYLQSRKLPDGWLNGENERVASPHMAAAILSVLEAVPDEDLRPWRDWSRGLVEALPGRGYFARWGFEPTDPAIDQYAALKWDLSARRILYGMYYVTLTHARRGSRTELLAWHAQAAAHLVAHRTGESWTSTAGEVASTSLALLTLAAPRGRLALYGDLARAPGAR